MALVVVVAIFPDVLFLGGSIRNSRILRSFESNPDTIRLLPETENRRIWHGYRDLGAAAWQLEPAQRFLRRCVEEGESPYWNPYSAGGTHGPERLASASFSTVTVATALLGAETGALHTVLLCVYGLSLFFLFRALTILLGRSILAASGACFGLLLMGFHTSMLGSQMVQPYVLAPILLYALLRLVQSPDYWRLLWAVLATALLLAETFLPVTLLTMISVHTLCLAWGASRWRQVGSGLGRQLLLQGSVSLLGLLLLAPLWFPIVGSVPLAEWGDYAHRNFETVRLRASLSLVTPKHFWESYSGFAASADENVQGFVRHIEATRVYHLGLVALLVVVQVLAARRCRRNPVVWAAALLIAAALGRTFGIVPLTGIEHLPVLGLISLQYWGALCALPFCILLAYGFDAVSAETVWSWPTWGLVGLMLLCVAYLADELGLPGSGTLAALHLGLLMGLLLTILLLFVVIRLRPKWRHGLVAILLLLMCGELVFYMNRLRPVRREIDFSSIEYVAFLRRNLKARERILNVGNRGILPNWGSALAIPQVDSLDGVTLRWFARFFNERFDNTEHFSALRRRRGLDPSGELATFDLDALRLLGVRFVLVTAGMDDHREFLASRGIEIVFHQPGVFIYELPNSFPRAFVVDALVEAPGIPSDWGLAGRKVAVTTDQGLLSKAAELGVEDGLNPDKGRSGTLGTVRVTEYHHDRVELDVELERPGVVVLADTWHPGWHARVGDAPLDLGRVDDILRGVVLSRGRHRLVLEYSPRFLTFGLVVSGLVGLLLAGGYFWSRRHASVEPQSR